MCYDCLKRKGEEMTTQTTDPQTIVLGSVIVTGLPGSNKTTQIFIREVHTILPSGNFFVTGNRITKDGFTDGRSRNHDTHYVVAENIIAIYGPESVKWAFPHCQLRVKS